MFHFTMTTKALEHNALVISSAQMERIIFSIAREGGIRVRRAFVSLINPNLLETFTNEIQNVQKVWSDGERVLQTVGTMWPWCSFTLFSGRLAGLILIDMSGSAFM